MNSLIMYAIFVMHMSGWGASNNSEIVGSFRDEKECEIVANQIDKQPLTKAFCVQINKGKIKEKSLIDKYDELLDKVERYEKALKRIIEVESTRPYLRDGEKSIDIAEEVLK